MKKTITMICAIIAFAVNVFSLPYTGVDTVNITPDKYVGLLQSASYHQDSTGIGPAAFTPANDTIFNYNVKIKLYDVGGRIDLGKLAFTDQKGILGDGFYTFNFLNNNLDWSFACLMNLNHTGKLDVSVASVFGDFYFNYSQRTATGNNVVPVPEPGTMVLLGFGLLGLAIYGKRRMNKDV